MAGLARTVMRTMFMVNATTRQFKLVSNETQAIDAIYKPGGPTREELLSALRLVIGAID